MVDHEKLLEENLREACSLGDIEAVEALISKGVNVNSRNEVNGWLVVLMIISESIMNN